MAQDQNRKITREELSQQADLAKWSWILPHAAKDAVILVAASTDFLDACVWIANNETAQVEHAIVAQTLRKPSEKELKDWSLNRDLQFQTLVLAPYVVIQGPCSAEQDIRSRTDQH
jgi:hypothetical protein